MSALIAETLAGSYTVHFAIQRNLIRQFNFNQQIGTTELKYGDLPFLTDVIKSFGLPRIIEAIRVIKKTRPNSIILCQGHWLSGLTWHWAAFLTNTKLVCYLPMCFPPSLTSRRSGRFLDWFVKLMHLLGNTTIVTLSRHQVELLTKFGMNRNFVIPNPILKVSPSCNYRQVQNFNRPFIIGVIGRIEFKQKGTENLVSIVTHLIRKTPDFRVKIVGDGPDLPELIRLVTKAKLSDYFEFNGWTSDVSAVLEKIDLVLSTSRWEGVPLTMLESYVAGKAFIAPDIAPFNDYLPNEWRYKNSAECAEVIRTFIDKGLDYDSSPWQTYSRNIVQQNSLGAFELAVHNVFNQL